MEDIAKYILLALLVLPFVALASDARGKTDGIMLKVVFGVVALTMVIGFMVGGLHQRPNVATVFNLAFIAWPILLLVAKGYNPNLTWATIWISVPVMSWYFVNTSMQFYYPTSGGGGGFGAALGLIAGWFYMVIPFAVLCGIFITVAAIKKRIKG